MYKLCGHSMGSFGVFLKCSFILSEPFNVEYFKNIWLDILLLKYISNAGLEPVVFLQCGFRVKGSETFSNSAADRS